MNTLAQILQDANNYDELMEELGSHELAAEFFSDDKLGNMLEELEGYNGIPADNFHHQLCWKHTTNRINQIIEEN